MESKTVLRWIYWWYKYHVRYFRSNFRILKNFIQYKLKLRNIEPDLELPFYGQLSMLVHKGYKIFDLRRGVVRKVFDHDIDSSAISAEIIQLKNVSKIDYAPTIRRWSIKERWYEEDYIQGSLEAGLPPDSYKLLERFYTHVAPCIEQVMFFQPPILKNLIEYIDEITRHLYSSELLRDEKGVTEINAIKDFIHSIVERLQIENNDFVYLLFTHGDFCPENMLRTNNGLRIFDWESATYRSALFDFYSYFFYRPVQHGIPVEKIVTEIVTALPIVLSRLSLKSSDISDNLLHLEKIYRWLYYLERISMLADRIITDTNLDIMDYISRYINAYRRYEELLADNSELDSINTDYTLWE